MTVPGLGCQALECMHGCVVDPSLICGNIGVTKSTVAMRIFEQLLHVIGN